MSLGKPLPRTAPHVPEWVPIRGRPHWFVSTDGKGRWMYAPPLNATVISERLAAEWTSTEVRLVLRLRGSP